MEAFKEVLRFERKKLVLPVLMCLMVLSFMAGLQNYRVNSYGETIAENDGSESFEAVAIALEHEYFNESLSKPELERRSELLQDSEADLDISDSNLRFLLMPGGWFYQAGLLPLAPSNMKTLTGEPGSFEKGGLFFSARSGYLLSRDAFETRLKWMVRMSRLRELGSEIEQNEENWTLTGLRERVDEIRSSDVNRTEKLRTLQELRESHSSVGRNDVLKRIESLVRENRITQVRPVHFLPSLIATFSVYYLLNGLLVVIFRRMKGSTFEYLKR